MKNLLFVVPMKDPDVGKSRLSVALSDPARKRLAIALFRQVLRFLKQCPQGYDILVVTDSDEIMEIADGALILTEAATGLSNAVEQAAQWAVKNRYRSICVLPADLADPSLEDLEKLLAMPAGLVLAPAHDGGTNCLIATPPDVIEFCYGPGSCKAHQRKAVEQGTPCVIAPMESFAYDIDTTEDLARIPKQEGWPKWA